MPQIHEGISIKCPFGRAEQYLKDYIADLCRRCDGTIELRLHVSPADAGFPDRRMIYGSVTARIHDVATPGGLDRANAIEWKPVPGAPFPSFSGFLRIQEDEDYGSTYLVLEGTYDPPYGTVGEIIDAAVDRRLARAVAKRLLTEIGTALEDAHKGSAMAASAQDESHT